MKNDSTPTCLLILGCGYVGTKLAQACLSQDIQIKTTARNQEHVSKLQLLGIDAVLNETPHQLDASWLAKCDALLDSIPLSYDDQRIPFETQQEWVEPLLTKLPKLQWAGYLSATSVYADSEGAWIDESSAHYSNHPRGHQRLCAEQVWLKHFKASEVFRLSGIYGPERNIINKLKAGDYKTVQWSPEHFSNRIHVDDIVAALLAALRKPKAQRIVNLSDDSPCSHRDYCCELAELVGAPAPIVLTEEEAEQQLSASYLDFFRDNKRISNQRLHDELLPELQFPSFRDAVPL